MDANEKAQRLMLVTDIKFRLDNKTGELIESEQPIPQEKMDEAMAMSKEEFESRNELKRFSAMASEMSKNFAVQCAYHAYALGEMNPISIEDFVFDVLRANKLS